jgi:hypothetical protein
MTTGNLSWIFQHYISCFLSCLVHMLNHLYCEWLKNTFTNYVSDCIEAN